MKITKEQLKKIILSEIRGYQVHESEEEPQLSPEHSEFIHELTPAIIEMYFVIEKVKEIIEESGIEPKDEDFDIDKELFALRRASRKFMEVVNREYNLELEDSGIDFYTDLRKK